MRLPRRLRGWRPALRIARRDALRARGRSALIVAMIALPVAGVGFADVMYRTGETDTLERLPAELGSVADVKVQTSGQGGPVIQRPTDVFAATPAFERQGGQETELPEPVPAVDPLTLLPPGSRWVSDQNTGVVVRTAVGLTRTTVRELAYDDPVATGLVTQIEGRAPRGADEVSVTEGLLDTLGLGIGDAFEVTSPVEQSFTIVGVVRQAGQGWHVYDTALADPDAILPAIAEAIGEESLGPPAFLVDTPVPFTWDDVLALNQLGVGALSRQAVENPPPRSAVPWFQEDNGDPQGTDWAVILVIALIVALAVLEVALLAGAAFAVGTRRQARTLGLVAATGGTRRHVRLVVLAQGLVLGVTGGTLGAVIGPLAAASLSGPIADWSSSSALPLDVRPLEMAAIASIGVFTGLLAALVPARTAARQDVVTALTGRRGVTHTRRRYPTVGVVMAVAGAGVALAGGAVAAGGLATEDGDSPLLFFAIIMIIGGAVLTQVGLILASPALVGAAARLGRFLPLSPRLALRDAARHRGRSAPAVAAVLTAVAGSVALTVGLTSFDDHSRDEYYPSRGFGQAIVYHGMGGPGERPLSHADIVAAVSEKAPPDRAVELSALRDPDCGETKGECTSVRIVPPAVNQCPLEAIIARGVDPTDRQYRAASGDPRCQGGGLGDLTDAGPLVADYPTLRRIVGRDLPAARGALEAGRLVVFDPESVHRGIGRVETTTYDEENPGEQLPSYVELPATYVDLGERPYLAGVFPPSLVSSFDGLVAQPMTTLLAYRHPPSGDKEEAVRASLIERGALDSWFAVERGYQSELGIGLLALLAGSAVITLGSAGIATGLAQADARADHATLAAVGAAPRVRRSLAAAQAAAIAVLGAALGTLSGFVPVIAYLYANPELHVIVPWLHVLVIGLVVPGVAATCAWLLTRSRLPLERRVA